MIWEIFKKEFRDQLYTFRFLFGLAFCLIVFPLFAAVIGGNLNLRQEIYLSRVQESEEKLSQVMVYGHVKPQIYRPPSKLSIICMGVEDQLPADAQILLQGILLPLDSDATSNRGHVESRYQMFDMSDQAKKYYEENRPNYARNIFGAAPLKSGLGFIGIFPGFDISFLVIFVFSLLALIFGYSVISDERESATIKLALSGNCSRFHFVLGKILAGFMSLIILVFISLILVLLTFMLLFNISFNASEWLLLTMLFVSTVLFVFVFLNIGVFFSCLLRQSSTSLMGGLVVWVLLVICSPVFTGGIVERYVSPPGDHKLNATARDILAAAGKQVAQINEEIKSNMSQNIPSWAGIQSDAKGPFGWYHYLLSRYRAQQYMTTFPYTEPVWIEAGNRMIGAMDEYYSQMNTKPRYFSLLSFYNPVRAYKDVAMALCGTDASAFFNFYEQAKNYRRIILNYLNDRNAFSNVRYTVGTDLSIDELPETRDAWDKIQGVLYDYENKRLKITPPPIHDIPRFTFKKSNVIEHVDRVAGGFIFLIILNLLLIGASILIFNKSAIN